MKKKITLKDIEVKSFVTKLNGEHIKGGANLTIKGCEVSDLGHSICRTCEFVCDYE